MVYDVALSAGDSLYVDEITPGGYRFMQHAVSAATHAKISDTTWNYVVVQAQSQEPSWPIAQVQAEVYPYATTLCDSIRSNNVCGMPVFYMTWGRKNGDASNCGFWPPVCTYEGMDSLLNERYQEMADDNNALVSPVGAVWNYIRSNYPGIELYNPDESHPSVAGSYAAACTFYTIIMRKDPTLITFDGGLPVSEAENIRMAAKMIGFNDLLNWNVGKFDPTARFIFSQTQLDVSFVNQSTQSDSYVWYFGDGDSTTVESPQHTYAATGLYEVVLEASKCGKIDSRLDTVIFSLGVDTYKESTQISIYPNPTFGLLNLDLGQLKSSKGYRLRIFNTSGVMVYDQSISNSTESQIDVRTFETGLYYLNITLEEQVIESKSFEVIGN
jgi:hypothetical protein